MKHKSISSDHSKRSARVFAALGDRQRLRLLARLSSEGPLSISKLTGGTKISRQAITKHLHVMQQAGVVRSTRRGRESLWQIEQRRIHEARLWFDLISQQWDAAIDRLRAFVEQ